MFDCRFPFPFDALQHKPGGKMKSAPLGGVVYVNVHGTSVVVQQLSPHTKNKHLRDRISVTIFGFIHQAPLTVRFIPRRSESLRFAEQLLQSLHVIALAVRTRENEENYREQAEDCQHISGVRTRSLFGRQAPGVRERG